VSTGTETNLTQAKQWCDEARAILKKQSSKAGKQLDERAGKIVKELKELRKKIGRGKTLLSQQALAEYELKFLAIASAVRTAGSDTAEIERQSGLLSELKKELAVHLSSKSGEDKAKAKFADRQEENNEVKVYLALRETATGSRTELAQTLKSDFQTELNAVDLAIAGAKTEADGGRYPAAITLLNGVDDLCKSASRAHGVAKTTFEQDYKNTETERGLADPFKGADPAVKTLITAQLKDYGDAVAAVDAAKNEGRWRDANGGVAAVKRTAQALADAGAAAQKEVAYETAYTQEIKTAEAAAKGAVQNATEVAKTRLDTQLKAFQAKAKIHDDAVAKSDWPAAQSSLADLKSTADTLNTAHDAYQKAKTEFETAYSLITVEVTKAGTVNGAPAPAKTLLNTELTAFNTASGVVETAKTEGRWEDAKAGLTDLKSKAETLNAAAPQAIAQAEYEAIYTTAVKDAHVAAKLKADNAVEPMKTRLAVKIKGYTDQAKVHDDAVTGKDWATAKSSVADLKRTADELIAAETQYEQEKSDFESDYNGLTCEITFAQQIADWNGEKLVETEIKDYVAKKKVIEDAKTAGDWVTARGGVAAFEAAVNKLVTEYRGWQAQSNAYGLFSAKVVEAWNLAFSGGPGVTTVLSKALSEKWNKYDNAKGAKKWVDAQNALPALETASDNILALKSNSAAQNYFTEYAKIKADVEAAAKINEKGLSVLIRECNEKKKAVADSRDAGDWTQAVAGLDAWSKAAKALKKDKETADRLKTAFETEWNKIDQAKLTAAREVAKSPPAGLATQAEAFMKEYQAANDDRIGQKWGPGKPKAIALKGAVDTMLSARDNYNTTLAGPEQQKLRDKLVSLQVKTNTANATGVPPFIDVLQKAVVAGVQAVTSLLSANNFAAAESQLKKLESDADAMIKGKDDHKKILEDVKVVTDPGGKDHDSRAATLAAELAAARNKGLDAAKAAVLAAAAKGMIAEAKRLIEVWKKQADGWKTTAVEAGDALAALKSPPPDALKLKALIDKPGGTKVFDDVMATLGDKPRNDVMKVVFQERFGVSLSLVKGGTDKAGDKGSKSVKKIFDLMAAAPTAHATKSGSLKQVVRDTTKTESGWYAGGTDKMMFLNCGRAGAIAENGLADPFQLPDIEPDCLPADTAPTTFFDWTTEHEIGHAVDDLGPYMGTRFTGDEYGGWEDHGRDCTAAAQAAMNHFTCGSHKFPLDKIKVLLEGTPSRSYNPLPPMPTGVDANAWKKKWAELVDWCFDGRAVNDPWQNGVRSKTRAINDRVYHEAYDWGKWVSYKAATRKKGITGYQFRAPGEWFSELYAAYRTGRLKPSHPAMTWLTTL